MDSRGSVIKETCRLIREARKKWDAHENGACRKERDRAMALYESLSKEEKGEIPEQLRVWLRYRSEKYFGDDRTPPGGKGRVAQRSAKKKGHAPSHSVAARKIHSPVGVLVILSSRKGISGVYFGHRIEHSTLPGDHPRDKFLNQAEQEIGEYFARERRNFSVALDARGSEFQRSVWRELAQIPFGETRGYSELAASLNNSGAVRAVGAANGANPISILVPCHRVIGKDGSLTGFGGGLDIKKKLLQLEGVLLEF